jgi:hypothetical protein
MDEENVGRLFDSQCDCITIVEGTTLTDDFCNEPAMSRDQFTKTVMQVLDHVVKDLAQASAPSAAPYACSLCKDTGVVDDDDNTVTLECECVSRSAKARNSASPGPANQLSILTRAKDSTSGNHSTFRTKRRMGAM